jgi:hypothetical protein
MHLIQLPNRRENRRALMALLAAERGEFLGLPKLQMVVSNDQIQALENAKVIFKYLSKTGPNGKKDATIRS